MAWRDSPPLLRLIRVLAIGAWAAMMVSLLTVGEIETAALRQPVAADSQFKYPHGIKGKLRYFTAGQERVYRVAKPVMLVAFTVGILLFCTHGALEQRLLFRKRQLQTAKWTENP